VVVAGRRWGKTQLGRAWLFKQALTKGAGRYWYVAPTRDDAKDIMWADLKQACPLEWLAQPPREGDLALNLVNGAEIRLWSAEKGSGLKGRRLKALVMDEYADMDAAMFFEVLRPSLGDFKAPALFIGTPKSLNHFYDLFLWGQSSAKPSWGSWQFKSIDNPYMDPQEIADAKADLDERTFRQEYEASFESVSGRVYWAFERAVHTKESVTLDTSLPVCIGFDFNYNPATAVIGQHWRDECRVVHEVFLPFRGGEATIASAAACRDWLAGHNWAGDVRLYGDSTGVNTKTTGPSDHQVIRDVFPRASWNIPTKQPNPRDRHASVNGRCKTADGKTHMRIDPSCVKLIADLERVVYAPNGDVDQKTDAMLSHISDALGYWVHQDWPPVTRTVAHSAHMAHWL